MLETAYPTNRHDGPVEPGRDAPLSPSPGLRDVRVAPVAARTLILQSRTWNRLKFEVEYALQEGTTANSYLIQADRVALIDPPGESFTEIYLQALQAQLDLESLDDIILQHVNPNRMATLVALVEKASPRLRLICTKPAANALRAAFPHWQHRLQEVRDGDRLDLGQGHNLEFVTARTPRWPDGLCTYDPPTGLLFADKFYGTHICSEALEDEAWKKLESGRRYYFDCLHAPQARQVAAVLDKLDALDATCLAPGHGPLVKYSLSLHRSDYRQWCQEQSDRTFRVALLYASAYGSTAVLADAIGQALVAAGVAVDRIDCEWASAAEIARAIAAGDGFIIGSPTLGGHVPTQIQTALGIVISAAAKTKLAGVFGSYGWSGEAIDTIVERLRNANYRLGFDPIRVRFSPTEEARQQCRDAAALFAQALRRQHRQRAARQGITDAQAARTEQAMGRILNSLCVLTTRRETPQNEKPTITTEPRVSHRGILTSAVSQASFNPPGIVAAIDPEVARSEPPRSGDPFVLNILKEGRNLRRHFQAGSIELTDSHDGAAGLSTRMASNGCSILADALAYLECTVKATTECGDRRLIYATVTAGDLLDPAGVAAMQAG